MKLNFTQNELIRYSRQMLLPDLKEEGQLKLKQSSVLVIGAGGLGSAALYYLCAAGVGRIGLLDFDVIEESNLQRQILYQTSDIGSDKSKKAAERLHGLNPNVAIESYTILLDSNNALDVISHYDVILDGSDNLPTRYLVSDACVLLDKTLIYGAIFQFEGQVSVFNQLLKNGSRGPNYRDLYPKPPPPEMVTSCSVGGVLGVLPGIIGSMQASEAIKVLTNMGTTLNGRLMIFDALDFTMRFLNIRANPDNPVSGSNPTIKELIDYEIFCNSSLGNGEEMAIKEISPLEVMSLLEKSAIQLIDVREPFEFELINIAGLNIPLNFIRENITLIEKIRPVVVHCKSGQRSAQAVRLLNQLGFDNVTNMHGGLLQWKKEVDPTIRMY